MDSVCEGYFLVTEEGLIFEVKGNVHPEDRYVAYLRYVPDRNGRRKSSAGEKYTKIYDIAKREKFLQMNFPQFLWFDEYSNRHLQAVPHEHISFILNPIDTIRQIRDKGRHLSDLERKTIDLVDALLEHSKIPDTSLGLTGSQLAGLANPSSDIDLVVYGERNCRQLYDTLKNDWDSILGLAKYEGRILKKHVEFRWGKENASLEWLQQRENSKVLQGIFDGSEFFIRLVKLPLEMEWKYGERIHTFLREITIDGIITDDSQGIFTPCQYSIICRDNPDLKAIMSYRGRFTEHVDRNMVIEARGRLESIKDRTDTIFQYLILGEKPTDYLLPVEHIPE